MKQLPIALLLLVGTAACGGSNSPATGTTSATSTNTSCVSTHECTNGVCECTTSGKEGDSCEENTCESTCEVCTS